MIIFLLVFFVSSEFQFSDMGHWERKKAVVFNLLFMTALSLPAVLGYNLWLGIQPMGAGTTIMDLEDFLVSYNILPLGSIVFVLFCVKKNGWGWNSFLKEANEGSGKKIIGTKVLQFYMTWILPLIIAVVYLKGYYDTFKEKGTGMLVGWMVFAVLLLSILLGLILKKPKEK